MAETARLNDIGIPIRLIITTDGAIRDLSGATTLEILLKKPGGSIVKKPAVPTTDGTDGQMEYVTVDGDLDEAGTWSVEGHIVDGTQDVHSTVHSFEVQPILVPTP